MTQPVPTPLADAVANMRVIERVVASAGSGDVGSESSGRRGSRRFFAAAEDSASSPPSAEQGDCWLILTYFRRLA